MLRKFDSGVMVIQNKSHSDEEVNISISLSYLHKILFHFYIKEISFSLALSEFVKQI